VSAAQFVASQADVTIVVAGTTIGESQDRSHLTLDGNMEDFVPQVASVSKKTVVLTMIPGQTLMEWSDSADGIATNFLAGEETGKAWAAVVFGDHSPTGKLPVMIPASEADTIKPNQDLHYSEGMRTSYRNTDLKALFPFGHGLSYTSFDFGAPQQASCGGEVCVKLGVTNTGSMAAKTVVQLYLEFPAEAQHPTPLLKGFAKTNLIQPGETAAVSIVLKEKDSLRYWDNGVWVTTPSATAHIGASSADIRRSLVLTIDAGQSSNVYIV
jgi:beta-glucosidase